MRAFAILCMSLLLAGPLAAQPWKMDREHSVISFRVNHLGFSDVHARFEDFTSEITFDPEALESTRAKIIIASDSFASGSAARDRSVKSKDFLNVEAYPEITFTLISVRVIDDDEAEVTGALEIIGETREVVFQAKLNRLGDNPFKKGEPLAGFTITGEIDRRDWGMDTFAPAIGAMVDIEMSFEMSPGS